MSRSCGLYIKTLFTILMYNSINCRLQLEGLLRISSRLHLLAPKIRVRVGLDTITSLLL